MVDNKRFVDETTSSYSSTTTQGPTIQSIDNGYQK